MLGMETTSPARANRPARQCARRCSAPVKRPLNLCLPSAGGAIGETASIVWATEPLNQPRQVSPGKAGGFND
jgi:hypothetical protein